MIINMGPQHPSTHGVLRLMLELQGETVLRCKPIIGYLHTGMEKTGETLTYLQGGTNVTRMDYLSPFFNELVFSMATEKLLGIDERHPRAGGVDPHADVRAEPDVEPPAVPRHQRHGPRRGVDDDLRLARARGGAALLPEGHRPADEPQLHPPRRRRRRPPAGLARRRAAPARPDPAAARRVRHADDRPADLARAAAGRRRDHARRRRSRSAPPARSCARPASSGTSAATCRTCSYAEVEFDVIVGSYGDAFDRYAIRLNEVRESMRIVRQVLDRMPTGDYRIQDKKVTPPPRARIDESMEALIHHFKLFTEGFKVPEGEVYVADREPAWRARLLHRQRRVGQAVPHAHAGAVVRQHPVPAAHDARRPRRRRRRHHLLGRPVSSATSIADEAAVLDRRQRVASPRRSSGATRGPKSALIPLLHLAQEQDGYVTNEAMAPHRRARRRSRRPRCSARRRSTRCSSSSRSASTSSTSAARCRAR